MSLQVAKPEDDEAQAAVETAQAALAAAFSRLEKSRKRSQDCALSAAPPSSSVPASGTSAEAPWTCEAWLRELPEAEEAARHSQALQARFQAAELSRDNTFGWLEVVHTLQRELLRARNVPPVHEAAALRALRAAGTTFPALAPISLYRRHNRARPGTLAPGSVAPDVMLLTLDGAPLALRAALGGMPTLLCAGSVS